MLFSQHFGITKAADDDWFDPILFTDTPLFIDPFLLFDGESGLFVGSHNEIIQFFNHLFQLIARSGQYSIAALGKSERFVVTG
jgi:hypothetical protein